MSRFKREKPMLMRITTVPMSLHKLLAGQMRFMAESGFDVVMVSSPGIEWPSIINREGCSHHIIPISRKISPLKDLISLFGLVRLMYRLKPDIVHTHTPKAGLLGMLAAKITAVPIRMHTIAGLPWMEARGFMRRLLMWVERLTASCAHKIYPNSNALLHYIKSSSLGIPASKLFVIANGTSNGLDLDHFERDEISQDLIGQLRSQSGISSTGKVWLFVGRLATQKGIAELVTAFLGLLKHHPEDQLWLVGGNDERDGLPWTLKKEIKDNSSICSWGYQEDVRPYMAAAYALVFPSYREGFPNVPLQAAAMGCPLILSDINGCNEIVSHGDNGLLVEVKNQDALYNAMSLLRGDALVHQKFSFKSRAMLEKKYSNDIVWNAVLHEYRLALNELQYKKWAYGAR